MHDNDCRLAAFRRALVTIVAAPALAVAAGCAAPQTVEGDNTVATPGSVTGETVRVDAADPTALEFEDASPEDVWKVLPTAFGVLRIPSGILDERSRVYGNQKVIISTVQRTPIRDLFRCGADSGLSLSDYRIEFGITAQPRGLVKGGTELHIQTTALGRLTSPSRTGSTNCVSNGKLEQMLHRQIEIELEKIGKASLPD
jgi:hypothetical protein